MHFNPHWHLKDKHAFLSASKYHWIRYDDDKLVDSWLAAQAAKRGSDIHELAKEHIRLGIKMGRSRTTLNAYVNDCIAWGLKPEVTLYYSDNAFCTADAIGLKDLILRISDLKTGVSKCSQDQLKIYAAYFCLEYNFKPFELDIELRIYQNDEVDLLIADPEEIVYIMDRIVTFDQFITNKREELDL